MLNLIGGSSYKNTPPSLKNKYGFYILCRLRHHLMYTLEFDEGWGEATEVLQTLWFRFAVIDRDEQEKAA